MNYQQKLEQDKAKKKRVNYLIMCEGYSQRDAAKDVGVHEKTVSKWIKNAFITTAHPNLVKHKNKMPQAKQLVELGYNYTEVGKMIDVTSATVGNWSRENNWNSNSSLQKEIASIISYDLLDFIKRTATQDFYLQLRGYIHNHYNEKMHPKKVNALDLMSCIN